MFRGHLNATRRRVPARSTLAFAVMCVALWPAPGLAQMFAHRVVVPVPLDDTTRAIGLLPGFSYFADIERGLRSTDDERAWAARLGGTIELWRLSRATSILIGTADEMVANSLKDGGFNPRGISWQLEIGAAHRFRYGTVQLDFVHYCRHAIDNIDPPGPAYFVPGYVATQRTLSVNGPRLRFISPAMQVGRRISVRGAVTGEGYGKAWDGRNVANDATTANAINSWLDARGSVGGDLRIDAKVWRGSGVYLRALGTEVLFSASASRPLTASPHENYRVELGWRAGGHRGGLELYGAVERLFDDLSSVIPHGSHVAGIGLRLSERYQF
ncbi:MAG TPA: hypothetical protein VIP11_07010 [Gemmatimonadaceae bacterium]